MMKWLNWNFFDEIVWCEVLVCLVQVCVDEFKQGVVVIIVQVCVYGDVVLCELSVKYDCCVFDVIEVMFVEFDVVEVVFDEVLKLVICEVVGCIDIYYCVF